MRCRIPLLVTILALSAPSAAHAVFYGAEPIDGPNGEIVGVVDADVARDGSGAVAYLRKDGGVDHVFVSRLVNGVFQPPERIDAALGGAGASPAVAASDGGRIVVVFHSGGSLFSVHRPAGAQGWSAPALVAAGGTAPSIDMSINGVAYTSFSLGGDVRLARSERDATSFAVLPQAADLDAARDAGSGTGRSRIAVSADGTALVVFGESGQVIGRRVFGMNVSTAPQVLNLSSLDGRGGGAADLPDVDIEDDSSFAWATFRQQFVDGPVLRTRAIAKRLIGSQFENPVVIDGLGWGSALEVNSTEVEISGRGEGLTGAGTSGLGYAAMLKDNVFQAPRAIAADPAPAPVGGIGENLDRTMAYFAGGEVRARFYDDKPESRAEPVAGPETPLSNPGFGGVDRDAGLDVAVNRAGDAVVVFVQDAAGARRLVAATYDRPPGAFRGNSTTRWRSHARPPLAWQAAFDLWGPITYTVEVDGQQVATTTDTKVTPLNPVPDGLHQWRVIATDRRGQTAVMTPRNLRVDATGPKLTASVRRRGGRVVRVSARASDPLPPSGRASGVAYIRVDWGDGVKTTVKRQRATLAHRYRSGARRTVRISATDKAGAATVVRKRVRPKR